MYGDLCDELTPRCELKNVKILQDLMICFNQLPGVPKNPPCPVWSIEKKGFFWKIYEVNNFVKAL